jgi:hypothetical protein
MNTPTRMFEGTSAFKSSSPSNVPPSHGECPECEQNWCERDFRFFTALTELSDLSGFHHRFRRMVFDQPLEFARNPGCNGKHPLFVNGFIISLNLVLEHQTFQN